MNSPHDESRGHSLPAWVTAVVLAVTGALGAFVIGLLTFGVQATVEPHHLPLAIGTTDPGAAAALAPVTERVAAQGGDAVDWRTVGSRAEAERLLDDKQVYGAVLFTPSSAGPTATILLSGALNPSASQVAQPVLTQVAEAVVSAARAQAAARAQGPGVPAGATAPNAAAAPAVQFVTIHPTSAAGRTLPLAASALLWLATLITGALAVIVAPRLLGGRSPGRGTRLAAAVAAALLGTCTVLGLARLWDSGLPIGWDAVGFLALVGLAFALLQAGVLRVFGLRGIALLAALYLTAPAVAGLVPELLNPVYRTLLWSWTPFRFSTEGLRSLLFLGSGTPDVITALWVFGGIALAGLVLLVLPAPRPRAVRAPAA